MLTGRLIKAERAKRARLGSPDRQLSVSVVPYDLTHTSAICVKLAGVVGGNSESDLSQKKFKILT